MKKLLLLLGVITFMTGCSLFTTDVQDPAAETWKNTNSSAWLQADPAGAHEGVSPAPGTTLAPGATWTNVSGGTNKYLTILIYDNDPTGPSGTFNYLNSTTVQWNIGCAPWTEQPPTSMTCADGPGACPGAAGTDCPYADGLLKITENGTNSYDVLYTKTIVTTPPIISNNWSSGMDNKNETLVTPGSYWVQDYGFNDKGRWTADGISVAQSTDSSTVATQPTYGSRAYPIHILNDSYKFDSLAPGTGFDGVWQMDIKIGSNSGAYPDSLYCETFYLAERKNLLWGASNYSDGGTKGGPAGWSTEIDIMETKWQKTGPQINIPTGGNPSTGWNPGYTKITTPQGLKVGEWSEAGATNPGGPTPDFVTFGAQIANDTLYFYGYLPGETKPWYTEAVPRDNSYVQKYPFVPYIGTWTDTTTHVAGGFKTMYKNFIYKKATDVKGNPISNPTGFGPGLK